MQNLPKICAFGAFHFNLLQNPQNPNFCQYLIQKSRQVWPENTFLRFSSCGGDWLGHASSAAAGISVAARQHVTLLPPCA
jgi:hypothetical protein